MSKATITAWRRLGIGLAASAVTLAIFAVGAIAVVSAPASHDQPNGQAASSYNTSELSRIAAAVDADTPTPPLTPIPTPEPTPQPTPEPAPIPATAPPPVAPAPVAQPAAAPPPTPAPTPVPSQGYRPDIAQALLTLLNNERAKAGVAAVAPNSILQSSSDYYAKLHFTTTDPYQLNHYLDGGPGNRAWNRGYCCAVGEILVTSEGSPESMVALWMDSASHHAVIVDPQYHEIGVSCYGGEHTSPDGSTSHPVLCSADFGAGGG